MKQRFFLVLGAFAASASMLLLGACDKHSWEDTQKQHQPHGAHAAHGDHEGDHAEHADDHGKAEADHDSHEKKAH